MPARSVKILLTSTFQPCGVDDPYGRKECVPEVQHNQLTQHQGVYSPRYWWPMVGTHLIAANLEADVTVLDWPTIKAFERELAKGYDYVGISFIHPTLMKFKKMAELTRELAPGSKIIAGGFGATISKLDKICEVDHICQGEGIRFMRDLLGQSKRFTFRHPFIHNEIIELLGVPTRPVMKAMSLLGGDISNFLNNILVTGLGCTYGCEFCSTSHFYKCAHLPFMRTGQEIYKEMAEKFRATKSRGFFFLGDENFFLDRARMEQLWKLQRESGEEFVIRQSFGSVDQLLRYDPEMLAETDFDHIWIGIESQQFPYPKSKNRDPRALIEALQAVGIKIVLSSILFLDGHTKDNIGKDVDYHISLKPEHSQFAGLAVIEGTPLYERMKEEGRLLEGIPMEDRHAFKQIWFWHPEFNLYESEKWQREAYLKDFSELGPSIIRSMMTSARAVRRLESSNKPRLKMRAARAICLAAAKAADTEKMRNMLLEFTRELEDIAGRMTATDKAKAEIIAGFARSRKLRSRLDHYTIQPRFRRAIYRQGVGKV